MTKAQFKARYSDGRPVKFDGYDGEIYFGNIKDTEYRRNWKSVRIEYYVRRAQREATAILEFPTQTSRITLY